LRPRAPRRHPGRRAGPKTAGPTTLPLIGHAPHTGIRPRRRGFLMKPLEPHVVNGKVAVFLRLDRQLTHRAVDKYPRVEDRAHDWPVPVA
jgi:hypothetical protein